jgi:alkylation response protein AidB-like acyl-CoA dehydrogenase
MAGHPTDRISRDAPTLLIGEGASEIQKMIIGQRLLDRFKTAAADWRDEKL